MPGARRVGSVPAMTYDVRELTDADAARWFRLGAEGFSGPPRVPGTPRPTTTPSIAMPGRTPYGLFDDGELVARAAVREYDSWFGHGVVPTCGIASVTVALEARGAGLLTPLVRHLHADARDRGAVIGTLYPTAPGIYRRFGYETIGAYTQVEVRTADLALLPDADATTRRADTSANADGADIETVFELYDTWAAEQNGPLTRSGPSFPAGPAAAAAELRDDGLAATLAEGTDGEPLGYALWRRTGGYMADGVCEVEDLVAVDHDGLLALLRALGTNASVAPVTRLWTSGLDVVRHLLPTNGWRVIDERPYMLAVLDVVGAFEARGYSTAFDAELDVRVAGDRVGDLDGSYRLRIDRGRAEVTRSEAPAARTYTPRGLALAFAGAQSSANLRFLGQLSGPATDDDAWDALLLGRQVHVRDYF